MHHINRSLRCLSPRVIIFSLVIIAIITSAVSFVLNRLDNGNALAVWWVGWLQNFSVGMLSSAIIFWLIDILFGGQREREAEEQAIKARKEQLIRQLASTINPEAIRATEELRASGWLLDGTLEGVSLDGANLQGADLSHARLKGVRLRRANLQGAIMNYADMKESDLVEANLKKAEFRVANLSGAAMEQADLRGAKFEFANLRGTSLRAADAREAYFADANMEGAVLVGTRLEGAYLNRANLRGVNVYYHPRCDERTILPDETHWQKDDDLTKFIDPTHTEFFEVITLYWHERNAEETATDRLPPQPS